MSRTRIASELDQVFEVFSGVERFKWSMLPVTVVPRFLKGSEEDDTSRAPRRWAFMRALSRRDSVVCTRLNVVLSSVSAKELRWGDGGGGLGTSG